MPKKTLLVKIELAPDDWTALSGLAKKGVASENTIKKLKQEVDSAKNDARIYQNRWKQLMAEVKDFLHLKKLYPKQIKAFFTELIKALPERQEISRSESRKHSESER